MSLDADVFARTFQSLSPTNRRLVSELALALSRNDPSPITATPNLLPFVDPWIAHLKNQGKTSKTYAAEVKRFLRAYPEPTPIDVETYFTLYRPKVKPASLFITSLALKNFLAYLQERGLMTVPPDAVPTVKYTKRRRKAPPPEDVARLLAYPKLKTRSKALLYILVDSGPRISEVLSLKRSDCDLAHNEITVTGKGNKTRTIPISPATSEAIAQYLATHRSSYVFPGQRALTWAPVCCEQHVRQLCLSAGIAPFTPHQLRHFFATQAIAGGAHIRSVSEILGHQSPSITLDVYCHTNPELNRQQHAAHSPLAKILEKEVN